MWQNKDIPSQINRYNITGILGKGGMGVVLLAEDPLIEREVAIKLMLNTVNMCDSEKKEYKLRFLNEVKILGKLNHPSIVNIFDAGFYNNVPYMVMEIVKGTNLSEYVGERGAMDNQDVINVAIQVSRALSAAHNIGILHRDIKPSNILIGQSGEVKLSDFSIAKIPDFDITNTGDLWGTPSFMSPEQLEGKEIDQRSDLFSLGAVLYYLSTANKPFNGKSAAEIVYNILHQKPLSIRMINKKITEKLERIILKCMDKKKENRYASAEELRKDLENCEGKLKMEVGRILLEDDISDRFSRSWHIFAEKTTNFRISRRTTISKVFSSKKKKKLLHKLLKGLY